MKALVLAGGKGSRLYSEEAGLPKALRLANGRPLLRYVLDALNFLPNEDVTVVVGFEREKIIHELDGKYPIVIQEQQLGTAHAVMCAESEYAEYKGPLLVCFGDMPLLTAETYRKVLFEHEQAINACTILTAIIDKPPDYGRIVRDAYGRFQQIVEHRDCTDEQRLITEVNVGVNVFDSTLLFKHLADLDDNNAQKEFFLPYVPKIFCERGYKVETCSCADADEVYGVNTPEELDFVETVLRRRDERKKQ